MFKLCLLSVMVQVIIDNLCSSSKNPYPPHGRSSEIPRGRGVLRAKFLEAMYENKPEFPGERGGGGGAKRKSFHPGASMDIYSNYTFYCTVY